MVLLEQEIEQVPNYLTIEKIRFEERFEYIFELEQAALESKIIKFILQPLVENAINHGLKNSSQKGILWIVAANQGQVLQIDITNNGKQLSDEQLSLINAKLEEQTDRWFLEEAKGSVGIKNVHYRIVNSYGKAYGLHYFRDENGYTVARIRIPAIFDERK